MPKHALKNAALTGVLALIVSSCSGGGEQAQAATTGADAAGEESRADSHEAYVGVYGSRFRQRWPYQDVDSKHVDKSFNLPELVFKIERDGDAYLLYYMLADPKEVRLLQKAENGLTFDGNAVVLSEDGNTLYLDTSDTPMTRIPEEEWRQIEPHAIAESCSQHRQYVGRLRGLTTYGELGAFNDEYFRDHYPQACRDNVQFYIDDIDSTK